MRTRRLLLAASALSTLTFGCAKDKAEPPPGNPKGVHYDAALVTPPIADAAPGDAGSAPGDAGSAPVDAGSAPGDAGSSPNAPSDAAPDGPRDAGAPRDAPKDAARRPPDARIYANPKGSTYDKGQDPLE